MRTRATGEPGAGTTPSARWTTAAATRQKRSSGSSTAAGSPASSRARICVARRRSSLWRSSAGYLWSTGKSSQKARPERTCLRSLASSQRTSRPCSAPTATSSSASSGEKARRGRRGCSSSTATTWPLPSTWPRPSPLRGGALGQKGAQSSLTQARARDVELHPDAPMDFGQDQRSACQRACAGGRQTEALGDPHRRRPLEQLEHRGELLGSEPWPDELAERPRATAGREGGVR